MRDKVLIKNFRKTVGGGTRISVYLIALLVTTFLTIYNQMVCPFLESLPFLEALRNLFLVNVVMLLFRELLYVLFPQSGKGQTEARHAYKLNVISWICAGLLAIGFHEFLYGAAFPWHSGLKILSGYWILGGGLIAQLEYILYERKLRTITTKTHQRKNFLEHISRRIIESSVIFIMMPITATLIMVGRYVIQDKLIPKEVAIEVTFLGVVFLIVAVIISVMYGLHLRKDTKEIVKALTFVKTGNFNFDIDETRTDELGAMASGINEMTEGLRQREKIRTAFGHFVNPEIAKKFIEMNSDEKGDVRARGETKNISVLMCDIRGFTKMSQNLPPETVTTILNSYFSEMVNVIQQEDGIIDKFIGDAVMALFGITNSADTSQRAVRASIGMRVALINLNKKFKELGFPQIDNGIGIHYGPVVAGYIGSKERLEYTVVGSTVNQAARLCDVARAPHPIVFSAAVAQNIQDTFNTTQIGESNLKGIGSVPLYTIKKNTAN